MNKNKMMDMSKEMDMPLDKYFKGKGSSVMKSMKKEYGHDKGEKVFYALMNKKKKKKKSKKYA